MFLLVRFDISLFVRARVCVMQLDVSLRPHDVFYSLRLCAVRKLAENPVSSVRTRICMHSFYLLGKGIVSPSVCLPVCSQSVCLLISLSRLQRGIVTLYLSAVVAAAMARNRKVAGSSLGRSGGRLFFSRVDFLR